MRDIKEYISYFQRNNGNGEEVCDDYIETISGDTPIILSTPHSINHFRNGKLKYCDINTGAIVRYVQDVCDCHCIYVKSYVEADGNYDDIETCRYKRTLKQYVKDNGIKLLLDIHGTAEASPNGIEFGTASDDNQTLVGYDFIIDVFTECFKRCIPDFKGKVIVRNEVFAAHGKNTVTNYISSVCGIPCLQIEINKIFREDETCIDTAHALIAGIRALSKFDWERDAISERRTVSMRI